MARFALPLALCLLPGAASGALAPYPKVWLARDLRKTLAKSRHPWLYDRALRSSSSTVEPGEVVAVTWKKETVGLGLYDPESVLRVRFLTWDARERPDGEWVKRMTTEAAERRKRDRRLENSTGLRLLHGENDGMPGIVLDAYEDVGVMGFDGTACEAFWRPHLAAVLAALAAAGFTLQTVVKKGSGELLHGEEAALEEGGTFRENGALFEVDVRNGHKTGFFLDQRDNRRRLRDLAAGQDVLDLFSYTGGFAVSAALGGAKSVCSVDVAGPAVAAGLRNFRLNGLEAEVIKGSDDGKAQHQLHVADCWKFLEAAQEQQRHFDIVVCDPPSMAPNKKTRGRALKAYRELNEGSLRLLRTGGLLMSCSCSSHITKQDMAEVVQEAAQAAGRDVEVESSQRAASDHPKRKGFDEGDYLQALYVRVVQ